MLPVQEPEAGALLTLPTAGPVCACALQLLAETTELILLTARELGSLGASPSPPPCHPPLPCHHHALWGPPPQRELQVPLAAHQSPEAGSPPAVGEGQHCCQWGVLVLLVWGDWVLTIKCPPPTGHLPWGSYDTSGYSLMPVLSWKQRWAGLAHPRVLLAPWTHPTWCGAELGGVLLCGVGGGGC